MQQRIVGSCRQDLDQSPGLVHTKEDCCFWGSIGASMSLPSSPNSHRHHHQHGKQVTLGGIKGRAAGKLEGEKVFAAPAGQTKSFTRSRKILEQHQTRHQRPGGQVQERCRPSATTSSEVLIESSPGSLREGASAGRAGRTSWFGGSDTTSSPSSGGFRFQGSGSRFLQ